MCVCKYLPKLENMTTNHDMDAKLKRDGGNMRAFFVRGEVLLFVLS
jgi:hypothetical protein